VVVARDGNDGGGIVEAVGWKEVEEGHVEGDVEGCPNECLMGAEVGPGI